MTLLKEYRQIPGDNTIRAARILHADRRTAEKMFCIEFTVIGRAHFPFDMLRYDMCYPVSASDASMMYFDYSQTAGNPQRRVRLRTWSQNRTWEPTYERWHSFGWLVTTQFDDGNST